MNLLRALVLLWSIKRGAHLPVRLRRSIVALGLIPNPPASCDIAATQTANAEQKVSSHRKVIREVYKQPR
uniref:Secreted protein n=1 Tax=Physcomitrium patens TaxID=3218 RepID=A0A2K1INT3_PHYPA|nr:hypothetical protein PHYPA_027246 [Physcomitrium patens]